MAQFWPKVSRITVQEENMATSPPSDQDFNPAVPPSSNTETLKVLADLAIAEIDNQSTDVEHFDRKLGLLLGFALVSVAQVVTALFTVTTQRSLSAVSHPNWVLGMVLAGLICVVLSVIAIMIGLYPRTFIEWSVAEMLDDYTARPGGSKQTEEFDARCISWTREAVCGYYSRGGHFFEYCQETAGQLALLYHATFEGM